MICKSLVELMGGQIWLQDDNQTGTTFIFTIQYDINTQVLKPATDQRNENNHTKLPNTTATAILVAFTSDREKYLSEGMDDYLSKPILRDELQRILRLYASNIS